MKSSWSINDFPAEDGDPPYFVEEPYKSPVRDIPQKLTREEWFQKNRNRKDRKGRGARMRAGEKKWATKGR